MSPVKHLRYWGLLSLLLYTAAAAAQPAGDVVYLSGTLTARAGDDAPRLLALQSRFDVGDVLSTQEKSFARLKFLDETLLALRPSTTIDVSQFDFSADDPPADGLAVTLVKGGLRSVSGAIGRRSRERVRYETPAGGIGIRGTHFGALYCQGDCAGLYTPGGAPLRDGLHVDVAAGGVVITNRAGSLDVASGQLAYVRDADTLPELVDEDEGYRVILPASVLFDTFGQLWSEEVSCDNCTVR